MDESDLFPQSSILPTECILPLSPLVDLDCKENPILFEENNFLTAIENSTLTSKNSDAKRREPKRKRSGKRWETDRRRHLAEKEAYQRLCEIVPDLLVLKRPTKIEILKKTILYITELHKDLEELENEARKSAALSG